MQGWRKIRAVAVTAAGLLAEMVLPPATPCAGEANRPNVVLVITDDQGYGDLGRHGNPVLRTPRLDRLAEQGVTLANYYVSPVCSPTRASLLTGRYHLRTGAVDTYLGRSMMRGKETTLAEALRTAGYRTGIFGKWHLGDCYPMRPQDQGFDECLVHGGGGVGQPADPPGNRYQNPQLRHNGQWRPFQGYCSDIYTTAAIDFIVDQQAAPFFVYLAFNCPHSPLEVPDDLLARYPAEALTAAAWPRPGYPVDPLRDVEAARRVYAMVSNIDDNVGRLLSALDERGIADNTLLIFMTDNGPQQERYNAGLRGQKASVYEGGVRAPCFARWPARWRSGAVVQQPTAHIDWMPTLLAACGAERQDGAAAVSLDGQNLLPLLDDPAQEWPERRLFFQWHRGDAPEPYRSFAVRSGRWKLLQAQGAFDERRQVDVARTALELYDLSADPYEQRDLAAERPMVIAELRAAYDQWLADVWRDEPPPRIVIGNQREPTTTLTRQDWRGPAAGWAPDSIGHWELLAETPATFNVKVRFKSLPGPGRLELSLGHERRTAELPAGARERRFSDVSVPAGELKLEAIVTEAGNRYGPSYVDVARTAADATRSPTP